jgi:hypothetical protein
MPTRKKRSPSDPGPNRTGDLWFRKGKDAPYPTGKSGAQGRQKARKAALGHEEATGARSAKLNRKVAAAQRYIDSRFSPCSCYLAAHAINVEAVDRHFIYLPEGDEAFFHILVHYGSSKPERCWVMNPDGTPCRAHATRGGILKHDDPRLTVVACNAHAAQGERVGTLTLWRRP